MIHYWIHPAALLVSLVEAGILKKGEAGLDVLEHTNDGGGMEGAQNQRFKRLEVGYACDT